MQRRRLLAGIVAGAAGGTAGCLGFSLNDPGIDDVDWLDGDDLDAGTLADVHSSALVDAGSFELFSTAETDHDGDEEPGRWLPSQEYVARFEAGRDRQYLRQEMFDAAEREVFELYLAGDEAFVREVNGERVATDSRSIERSDEEFRDGMREESLSGVRGVDGWNMTVDDRAAEFADRPAVRLVADEFTGDAGIPEEVSSANATMYVTEEGLVPSLEQRWEGTQRGQGATVDIDIAFRDVGETTVEEPDWAAELRE